VLITGADIVYRPSLFGPLLTTLTDLYKQLSESAIVDIWLSCQSIRSHLNDFWDTAARHGFSGRIIAVARQQVDDIQYLSQIEIEEVSDSFAQTPFVSLPKGLGISWIISLARN
jgi:hypothetical protein